MHRLTMVGLACLALAFVAGCGDDKNDSSSTPAAAKPAPRIATTTSPATTTTDSGTPAGAVVKVSMKDIKFVPEKITAKVGQKIEWTNDDAVAHNVTATDGADFASDTIDGGGQYSYKPTKTGVIKYVCTIHSGQNGEITVTK
jgi:plastocyanin